MNRADFPLMELFTRLREAGLPLGIKDYDAVLQALQAGYGIPDQGASPQESRAALTRLCQTLWVRSPDEQQLLNFYFDQLVGLEDPLNGSDASDLDIQRQQLRKTLSDFLKQDWVRVSFVLAGGVGLFSIVVFNVARWTPPESNVTNLHSSPPANTPKPSTPSPSASIQPSPPALFQQPVPLSQGWWAGYIGLFLAMLFGASLIGIGIVWLLRRYRVLERLKPRHLSLPKPPGAKSNPAIASDLLREMKDEVQVAQAVQQMANQGKRPDRFVLNSDYLPVTQRQMKQSWRYLRRMVRAGPATELDVEGSVQRIARDGLLLEPALMARRTNRMELVLLIDQDGSMVPFHPLSTRLVETALRGGRLGRAGAYYFHNCPIGYLYHDPMHQDAIPIQDVLDSFRLDRTVVLIFSDAGAARGGFNGDRVELTSAFLQQLKQRVRRVVWLNPMPRYRWTSSTAGKIAQTVPMFEATRQGLDRAIDALRGRHQTFTHLREEVK